MTKRFIIECVHAFAISPIIACAEYPCLSEY